MLLKHAFIRRAGKTEMLRELVHKARQFEQNGRAHGSDVRYYEETLREMSSAVGLLDGVHDIWDTKGKTPAAASPSSSIPTPQMGRRERVYGFW